MTCGLRWALLGVLSIVVGACGTPTEPGEISPVRLTVKEGEPYVVFVDQPGRAIWEPVEYVTGSRGLMVRSRWRVLFPVTDAVHEVGFDRIKRDSAGTTIRYRAEVDGEFLYYDAADGGADKWTGPDDGD